MVRKKHENILFKTVKKNSKTRALATRTRTRLEHYVLLPDISEKYVLALKACALDLINSEYDEEPEKSVSKF